MSSLTLLISLNLKGCSIYSRNRPCLSLLSGGHYNIINCFKSFKSEIFSVIPGTAFSIKIITKMLVGRGLWRSVVQPPTQSRTFTNTRAGQLWPHTGKPRKLPTTEIHHIWWPVPVLQPPPCEEILPAVPAELPKLKSVATALCFSRSSSSTDPCWASLISCFICSSGTFCCIIQHLTNSQLDLWAHPCQSTLSCRPLVQYTI